jgi:sphingolipid 4-desaturase/C4-monooxygenase
MAGAFFVSALDQPHPARTRTILKAHPEIRGMMGRNPWTALIMVCVVTLQVALAAALGALGLHYWWAALLAAYGIGAFANHCLYVVIHDATHKLIFKSRMANYLVAIIGDLPNLIPGAIGFSICHLAHHARQGDYAADGDLASNWEARLIGNRWYGKALWLLVFPLFQLTRPGRLKGISVINRWSLASVAACALFDVAVVLLFGWNALLYLAASMLFSIGLHPLGSRWIQEHFTLDPEQETGSYYGKLNRLALNVGYHNEHHDFPSVPWNRLPDIRKAAPEFYDTLIPAASWTRLWLTFICNPNYSLYSRVLRAETGR